jgi:hypothetical protein
MIKNLSRPTTRGSAVFCFKFNIQLNEEACWSDMRDKLRGKEERQKKGLRRVGGRKEGQEGGILFSRVAMCFRSIRL